MGFYPLLSQAPTPVEVELGCDNKYPTPPPSKRMKTRLTPPKASSQSQPARNGAVPAYRRSILQTPAIPSSRTLATVKKTPPTKKTQPSQGGKPRLSPAKASNLSQPASHGADEPAFRRTILQKPAISPKKTPAPAMKTPAVPAPFKKTQSCRLSKSRLTPPKAI